MNKLGLYINNLMSTIKNTEEKSYLRELAIDELKKLNESVSGFIFEWVNEIETLPAFEENVDHLAEESYLKHWTCRICGENTNEVEYDYLSGTEHLGCVLKQENFNSEKKETETNQIKINFGEKK